MSYQCFLRIMWIFKIDIYNIIIYTIPVFSIYMCVILCIWLAAACLSETYNLLQLRYQKMFEMTSGSSNNAERQLRQNRHGRVASHRNKIHYSGWHKWCCALWPYMISQAFVEANVISDGPINGLLIGQLTYRPLVYWTIWNYIWSDKGQELT